MLFFRPTCSASVLFALWALSSVTNIVDALSVTNQHQTTRACVDTSAKKECHHHDEQNVDTSGRRALLKSMFVTTAAAATTYWLDGTDAALAADEGEGKTFHKLDYPVSGKCGQANNVPEKAAFFVKQFGGFSDGSCAVDGYTVEAGTANGTGEKDSQRVYAIYGK